MVCCLMVPPDGTKLPGTLLTYNQSYIIHPRVHVISQGMLMNFIHNLSHTFSLSHFLAKKVVKFLYTKEHAVFTD